MIYNNVDYKWRAIHIQGLTSCYNTVTDRFIKLKKLLEKILHFRAIINNTSFTFCFRKVKNERNVWG